MENEIWRPIIGFEDMYEISTFGRVKSLERISYHEGIAQTISERIMKQYKVRGYPAVKLCKNGKAVAKTIHRLKAIAFIPNPKNLKYINHKNGIKDDHRLVNLEWCTHKQNMAHAFKTLIEKHFRIIN